MPEKDVQFYKQNELRCKLKIAFFEKNAEVARAIGKQMVGIDVKNKLLVWGACNSCVNHLIRPIALRN
jgi:hypothetical protein